MAVLQLDGPLLQLQQRLVQALKDGQYEDALDLVSKGLVIDPSNASMAEFKALLLSKHELDQHTGASSSEDEEHDDDDSDDSDEATDSEAGTDERYEDTYKGLADRVTAEVHLTDGESVSGAGEHAAGALQRVTLDPANFVLSASDRSQLRKQLKEGVANLRAKQMAQDIIANDALLS